MDDRDSGASPGGSASQPYRLVLADDHEGILQAVQGLLSSDFEVIRAVKDGAALIEAVEELRPDAVICDIYMPGKNGIECGAYILRNGLSRAVVILSMYNEPHLVSKARQEGIQGYVLKEDASSELVPAVYAVLAGKKYVSRGVMKKGID